MTNHPTQAGHTAALPAELSARVVQLEAVTAKLAGALEEARAAIERGGLEDQMCCNGHMCGCRGSTNEDFLLHCLAQALTEYKDATDGKPAAERPNHD